MRSDLPRTGSPHAMDLERLRIDRRRPARRTRRGRPGTWLWRVVWLAAAAGLLFLFRRPLADWLDRLRLPEVDVVRVISRRPAELAAISGAAANGYVVARTRAALSADTPGRIVELNVREGQAVKKGEVVARLYAEEYAAALRQAKSDVEAGKAALRRAAADRSVAEARLKRLEAELAAATSALDEARAAQVLARVNFERTRRLVEEATEAPQQLDERKADLDRSDARVASAKASRRSAEAAVAEARSQVELACAAVEEAKSRVHSLEAARDLAQATLDKTEVRAPFDGIVVLKDAEVGEVVSPNSQAGSNARGSVVTMVDFDSLEIQAEVPETSIASVVLGAPARIFLDAYPDRAYHGRVDRIWPTADRQKATIEVRVVIEDPDDRLRPEMGVRVVFEQPEPEGAARSEEEGSGSADGGAEPVLLVPASAVVRSGGRALVFVVERDVVREREVEIGERRGERVIVRSGLETEERVVRDPPPSLADGDRVRPRSAAR